MRRFLLLSISVCIIGGVDSVLGSDVYITDTSKSPNARLQPVGIAEVNWTDGFWTDRSRVCRERSIPAMWEIMRGTQYKPFLKHFLIAAGKAEGDYHGAAWNDGDFYKWIEAACAVLAVNDDATLEQAVATSIDAIAAAQREDGYLHTPVLIRRRNGDRSARPLADRHDFEVYNMGHLMTAGCIRARATGDRRLLEVAERAALFLETAFAEPTPEIARNSVCPSHYMGLVELYRTTREERYLHLARKLFDLRHLVHGGSDDNQDRIPFVEQREAAGHAVRANYLYAGAADLYLETGDASLWEPLDAIWNNVVAKKLYVTGGCGALYDGASPDGSPDQGAISRVHQSYGRNYQLPNTTAHNETCAAIGAAMWNWRMFAATADVKYIDWLELAMYNAVLSGVSLDGTDYFYVNPLRNVDPLPVDLRWSRTRAPFLVSYCCPPNVVRTIAEFSGYAYSKADDEVLVNLYGSNRLRTSIQGERVELEQQTNYPWDGTVRLRIEQTGERPWQLQLRIPGWAGGGMIEVNDEAPLKLTQAGYYHTLSRQWKAGDMVTLTLPMPVTLLESHPLVEETRNHLAVKRGPIVYCLESIDLPADVDFHNVAIAPDANFSVHYAARSLGWSDSIEHQSGRAPGGPWQELYRPRATGDGRSIDCQLIPYFAWGNRGDSQMTVWLPRQ